MLNEAVLKCAAVSQKNAGREGERERGKRKWRNGIALMLDFLCEWERFQKGNTGSHIPQMQKTDDSVTSLRSPYLSSD